MRVLARICRAEAAYPACAMVLLCAWCVVLGVRATRQQEWPLYHDAYRDIGVAQSILDGRYPEDPILRGETLWYTPVTGALVALGSRITGLPPYLVDARLGAYLNALLPAAFFVMVWVLFDPWVALTALIFFVTRNASDNPTRFDIASISYSPWLWATYLGHVPFYASIALYVTGLRRGSLRWFVAAGAAWGLAFMTHATPAFVLGGAFLIAAVLRVLPVLREYKKAARGLAQFLTAAVIAFAVSLPYTGSILWNYQFRIRNPGANRYIDFLIALDRVPETIAEAVSPYTLFVLAGFLAAFYAPRLKNGTRAVLGGWLVTVAAFLLWGYAGQVAEAAWHVSWTYLLPLHHFFIQASALTPILAGLGVVAVSRRAARVLVWLVRGRAAPLPRLERLVRVTLPALVAAGVTAGLFLPRYVLATRFESPVDFGWPASGVEDRTALFHWLTQECPPDAVVLCDENVALRFVMPAARKVVATWDLFMNPYVAYDERTGDRVRLFTAIESRDDAQFAALAAKYHVTHVLVRDSTMTDPGGTHALTFEQIETLDPPYLTLAYHGHGLAVYAARL
ncbi:MAG: hypothetical protein KA184_02490 [Candidatus Hydrogenedentes bacterium]|nr:hypothetical protein [Candidatus Hydrogenedentota bacterium]